jgi:hypothetical protein
METLRRSAVKVVIFLLFFFSLCSCTYGEKKHFNTYDDFSRSDLAKGWIPIQVPSEAREIDIWHNIDTNSVRVSFEYGGPLREFAGYQKLNESLKKIALQGFPSISDDKSIHTIWYQCKEFRISSDDEKNQVMRFEVRYIGDTGKRIFYWNDSVPESYSATCASRGAKVAPSFTNTAPWLGVGS